MRKYIVISQQTDGNGDTYQYLHDTLDDANRDADMRWRHLNYKERMSQEILVVAVEEDDLDPSIADDDSEGWDGERDWFAWGSYTVLRNLAKQEMMEIMVDDWLADHHDEMQDLSVDWDTFHQGEMTVEAEDEKNTYSLHAIDGDIYISYSGTKR